VPASRSKLASANRRWLAARVATPRMTARRSSTRQSERDQQGAGAAPASSPIGPSPADCGLASVPRSTCRRWRLMQVPVDTSELRRVLWRRRSGRLNADRSAHTPERPLRAFGSTGAPSHKGTLFEQQSVRRGALRLATSRDAVVVLRQPLLSSSARASCVVLSSAVNGRLLMVATQWKPQLTAAGFRFDPIVCSGLASGRTDTCSVSARYGPQLSSARGSRRIFASGGSGTRRCGDWHADADDKPPFRSGGCFEFGLVGAGDRVDDREAETEAAGSAVA
jgi:hypothetical protein